MPRASKAGKAVPRVKGKAAKDGASPTVKPVAGDPYGLDDPKPAPATLSRLAQIQDEDEQAALRTLAKLEGTGSMQDLIALAEEMKDEKDTYESLEAEVKVHKDRYNELRHTLIPEMMRQLGIVDSTGKGSFTFRNGKIHLETTVSASCTKENEPKFFAWAKANGAGDIIKTTVNSQTLSALIRERRHDGLEDPPGVVVFEQVKAKLTVK